MSDLTLSPSLHYLAAWVLGFNLLTFLIFGWDKYCAKQGHWRVREGKLIALCVIGGGFGGKMAQVVLRHKTRKQPFATLLNVALAMNALLVLAVLSFGAG